MIKRVVVDASVALAWVLPGEDTKEALSLRNLAADSIQYLLLIPPTFWLEVTNVLWVAVRSERLNRKNAFNALELLINFEFTDWAADPASCLKLSLDHGLAVYDSVYLGIAIEQQAELWTMDQALKNTAEDMGLKVLP